MGLKKSLATIMAVPMLLGAYTFGHAAEFKFSGSLNLASEYQSNPSFENGDGLKIMVRFRPRLDAIINENLYSSLQLQVGTYNFGLGPAGIGAGNNSNVEVRQLFVAAKMPGMENLKMTFGIQNMATPSATFGSFILDDNVAGISVAYGINEMVAFNLAWNRPYITLGGKNDKASSAIDYVQIDVPVSFSGVTFTPWVAFANITEKAGVGLATGYYDNSQSAPPMKPNSEVAGGNIGLAQSGLMNERRIGAHEEYDSGYITPTVGGFAWWVGAAVEIDLIKNLNIGIDAVYGGTKFGSQKIASREGFVVALDVSYTLPMFTPAIKYWYASGNRKNSGYTTSGGIMPSISASYVPLYFAFADSSVVLGDDGLVGGYTMSSTQGVVLELSNISFMDNLTHIIQLGYVIGTTDRSWVRHIDPKQPKSANNQFDPTFLTTEDNLMALNFITTYNIYENFSTTFGIGYLHMLTANKYWAVKPQDNVLSVALGFQYAF